MTRRKSLNKSNPGPSSQVPQNILQANRAANQSGDEDAAKEEELSNLKSLLNEEENQPTPSSSTGKPKHVKTAPLYDELNSFRQRWRRELDTKSSVKALSSGRQNAANATSDDTNKENEAENLSRTRTEAIRDPYDIYTLAKKLFLTGVELEQDDAHHEAIRYYKQAVHLCPDIERQIFREQCEASLKASGQTSSNTPNDNDALDEEEEDQAPLYDRILLALSEGSPKDEFKYCRPTHKHKKGVKHIGDLPHDLLLLLSRYVIGQEMDLASFEALGMVCRGLFILSRDPSLWRSICFQTWGSAIIPKRGEVENNSSLNWRQIYIERPRVNCDGVYISRTRYVRQGDVSFQDMAYRPFHVVRYYRYIRFFPDKRVLILTTNEEPEKIVPIFRHALHAKQISELSILEGTYEFTEANHIVIDAEKDFTSERNSLQHQQQHQSHHQRRQALFHWSRQTPLSQRSNLKFELKTADNRPYRNNLLKWLEYTITTVLESGQEVTTYDLSPETFPNLIFSRVKRFNLRLTYPLTSH